MKILRPVEPRAITALDEARFELRQFGWPESTLWVVPCLIRPDSVSSSPAISPNHGRVTELWNAHRVCADVTGSLLFLLERLTVASTEDDSRCFTESELRTFLGACRRQGVDLLGAMGRFGGRLSDPSLISALLKRHDTGTDN